MTSESVSNQKPAPVPITRRNRKVRIEWRIASLEKKLKRRIIKETWTTCQKV
jgi:hypothetical protein